MPVHFGHEAGFEHDAQRRVSDASKAGEVLGFVADTGFEDMLDEAIPWLTKAIAEGTI